MSIISSYIDNPLLQKPTTFKNCSCVNTNLSGMKNITECILPNVTIVDVNKESFMDKLKKIFKLKK